MDQPSSNLFFRIRRSNADDERAHPNPRSRGAEAPTGPGAPHGSLILETELSHFIDTFHNRARDQLRIFFLDDDGCQMLTKFLPEHAFLLPVPDSGDSSVMISVATLPKLFRQ